MDNSNLTPDALKYYQKQGLSISLINKEPLIPQDKTVPIEIRPKQNINPEKIKTLPRSLAESELKAATAPSSSLEARSLNNQLTSNQTPINQNIVANTFDLKTFHKQSVPVEGKIVTSSQPRTNQSSTRLLSNVPSPAEKTQTYRATNQMSDNICQNKLPNLQGSKSQIRMPTSTPLSSDSSRSTQNVTIPTNVSVVRTQVISNVARLNNLQLKTGMVKPVGIKVSPNSGTTKIPMSEQFIPRSRSDSHQGPTALYSEHAANIPVLGESTSIKKIATLSDLKSVKVMRVAPNNVSVAGNQSKVTTHAIHSQKISNQIVKVSSVAEHKQQFDESEEEHFEVGLMSPPRTAVKRPQQTNSPVPKKKSSSNFNSDAKSDSDINTLSSDEGSPRKDSQCYNIKGLTITPVAPKATPVANPLYRKTCETTSLVVLCPNCKQLSFDTDVCSSCQHLLDSTAPRIPIKKPNFVVTETTTSVKKKVVLEFPDGISHNENFHFKSAMHGKMMVGGSPIIPMPKGKGRPRRIKQEPICYTLSSDDEEPMQQRFFQQTSGNISSTCIQDDDGSKSSNSEMNEQESQEFNESDDFPGVTDINSKFPLSEDEPDDINCKTYSHIEDIEESDDEDCEDEEDEAEDEEDENNFTDSKSAENEVQCRSVRIGEFKIHPIAPEKFVQVTISDEGLCFPAVCPKHKAQKIVYLILKPFHVRSIKFHFGRCLPILFVYPEKSFEETVKKAFELQTMPEFDPLCKNPQKDRITFLIHKISDHQKKFFRNMFPGDNKVEEINQKTANSLLVESTPNRQMLPIPSMPVKDEEQYMEKLNSSLTIKKVTRNVSPRKNTILIKQAKQPQLDAVVRNVIRLDNPDERKNILKVENRETVVIPITTQENTRISTIQQKCKVINLPVEQLLTYPPPPIPGGITITSEDVNCLNEGEFLNDAIIDFYLKYIFYEKLSDYSRSKTHIFSSYFYPRLTQKPERAREDGAHTMQFRRHSQVKKWTKNVDIFDKDFIIIPVNLNIHWFLAIICYPGRVHNSQNITTLKKDSKDTKSFDNVTSSDEQDDKEQTLNLEATNINQDDNSMNSSVSSPYTVEEPPDTEESSPEPPPTEMPDSTTNTDNVPQKKETPCICIFDSLSGPNRWRIAATLREYLEMEWSIRKGTKKVFNRNTMQGFVVKCPQQNNYSDCGLYLLQYVESFFENPTPCFGNSIPDLSNWFSEAIISEKRTKLQELIKSLQKKKLSRPIQKSEQSPLPSSSAINENR